MLSKQQMFQVVVLLVSSFFFQTGCKQSSKPQQSIPTMVSEPTLKLPSSGAPLATPLLTPYDPPNGPPLSDKASTKFWDVEAIPALFTQDNMPTIEGKHSDITVSLKIINHHNRPITFNWEALLYEMNKAQTYPVKLFLLRRQTQPDKLTAEPGKSIKIELSSLGKSSYINFSLNEAVSLVLILKLTDEEGNSATIRPQLKFQMTY